MKETKLSSDRIYEITAAAVALLVVGGAVIITAIGIVLRGTVIDPPGWLQTAVGAVIGFYFARRSQAQDRLSFLAAMEANGAKKEQ